MSHIKPPRTVLHRTAATTTIAGLLLALFVAATAGPVWAADPVPTFTVAQALSDPITFGESTQIYALVRHTEASALPTGTVSFYACAPETMVAGTCPTGTFLGQGTLDSAGNSLSPHFKPSHGGTWCVRAAYSGSATAAPSAYDAACFTVKPTFSRMAIAATAAEVETGSEAHAVATVIGISGGPVPTGSVAFSACVADLTLLGYCTSPLTSVGTTSLDAAAQAVSPPFVPTEPGTWCWRGDYGGDATYKASAVVGACFVAIAPPPADPVPEPAPDNGTADNGTADNGTADNGTADNGTSAPTAPPTWLGPGGWRHAHAWPVDGLTLAGAAYTNEEARALLGAPARGDAGNLLARHLITAMLNRQAGATGDEADAAIAEADAYLASLGGPDAGAKMAKGTGKEVGRLIALMGGGAGRR